MVLSAPSSFRDTHRFCVAPMMAWTDRHARFFLRLITKRARLYTEMVPLNGLLRGDQARFLEYSSQEHPVALQLGGADPKGLALAAKIGHDWGYDEINLNVGCPSDRVVSGSFGAYLMGEPLLVAECVSAMTEAVSVPITIKCRIGIDDMDINEPLDTFVEGVMRAGCTTLIVHARKAWLKGLSPKENRTIPPLNYERVYRLRSDFPDLWIVINGGINTVMEAKDHLRFTDGVMLGRAAYESPYMLADVDNQIYGQAYAKRTRHEILEDFVAYCQGELTRGTPLHHMTRHILGLYGGCQGAKYWRQCLSTEATKTGANTDVIMQAAEYVSADLKAA